MSGESSSEAATALRNLAAPHRARFVPDSPVVTKAEAVIGSPVITSEGRRPLAPMVRRNPASGTPRRCFLLIPLCSRPLAAAATRAVPAPAAAGRRPHRRVGPRGEKVFRRFLRHPALVVACDYSGGLLVAGLVRGRPKPRVAGEPARLGSAAPGHAPPPLRDRSDQAAGSGHAGDGILPAVRHTLDRAGHCPPDPRPRGRGPIPPDPLSGHLLGICAAASLPDPFPPRGIRRRRSPALRTAPAPAFRLRCWRRRVPRRRRALRGA